MRFRYAAVLTLVGRAPCSIAAHPGSMADNGPGDELLDERNELAGR